MRTIHMYVGIPGSGKTTHSKQLQEKLGCMLVSSDRIRQLHPDWEEAKIFPEVYRVCAEELLANRDVILDATNIDRATRAKVRTEIEQFVCDFSIGVYWLNTPWEECKSRVIKRNLLKSELILPPHVVDYYRDKLEVPSEDEGFAFIEIIESNQL